jgi:large subunit ribosomal protein L15e
MAKGAYRYMAEAWQKPEESGVDELVWSRLIDWRREGTFTRAERPTRLDRARALGYRAKQGYVVVRTHIRRGSLQKHKFHGGRKARARGLNRITLDKSLKQVAEQRVAKHYPNMEVLSSYWIASDGRQHYYEIILVDPDHPSIKADPKINWICEPHQKGRAHRGKTSAGLKSRGLRHKGMGAEHRRPSVKKGHRRARRGHIRRDHHQRRQDRPNHPQ